MGFFDRFKKEKVANNIPEKSEKETMSLEEIATIVSESNGEKIMKLQMLVTELEQRSTYNPALKEVCAKITDMLEKIKSADINDINKLLDDMAFDISMLRFDLEFANAPDIVINLVKDLDSLSQKDVQDHINDAKLRINQFKEEEEKKKKIFEDHEKSMQELYDRKRKRIEEHFMATADPELVEQYIKAKKQKEENAIAIEQEIEQLNISDEQKAFFKENPDIYASSKKYLTHNENRSGGMDR